MYSELNPWHRVRSNAVIAGGTAIVWQGVSLNNVVAHVGKNTLKVIVVPKKSDAVSVMEITQPIILTVLLGLKNYK